MTTRRDGARGSTVETLAVTGRDADDGAVRAAVGLGH
jgi:hypothetical protein